MSLVWLNSPGGDSGTPRIGTSFDEDAEVLSGNIDTLAVPSAKQGYYIKTLRLWYGSFGNLPDDDLTITYQISKERSESLPIVLVIPAQTTFNTYLDIEVNNIDGSCIITLKAETNCNPWCNTFGCEKYWYFRRQYGGYPINWFTETYNSDYFWAGSPYPLWYNVYYEPHPVFIDGDDVNSIAYSFAQGLSKSIIINSDEIETKRIYLYPQDLISAVPAIIDNVILRLLYYVFSIVEDPFYLTLRLNSGAQNKESYGSDLMDSIDSLVSVIFFGNNMQLNSGICESTINFSSSVKNFNNILILDSNIEPEE